MTVNNTFYTHTLGCRVNQYETRAISEELRACGCIELTAPQDADFKIINTCAVTGESERKSLQAIRRIASAGSGKTFVVGCCPVPENKRLEGVFYAGNAKSKKGLVEIIKGTKTSMQPSDEYEEQKIGSYAERNRARSFIKVQDGCSNHCSYCIIPSLRGASRSRNESLVLEEIKRVVSMGTKEIVLTGIEISAYPSLPELIVKAGEINGVERIRLGSLDPRTLTPEFLAACAQTPQFMPHMHLSLQSGCSRILALMKRQYNKAQAEMYIERALEYIPGLVLSMDIITSFPGETLDELNETIELVKRYPTIHVHAFPFSPRPGTAAAELPELIDKSEKKKRCLLLIGEAERHRQSVLSSFIGTAVNVLVEKSTKNSCSGMCEHYIETEIQSSIPVNSIVKAVITEIRDNKLIGQEAESYSNI